MARIRSVHPDICTDEALASLPASAERTFVRLWTHLDDDGRAVDNPKLLKAALYPLHDEMTVEALEGDLATIEAAGLVVRYVVDGRSYLSAKPESWARWQKPRRHVASKCPPPPDNVGTSTRDVGTASDDGDTCTAGGGGVIGGVGGGGGDASAEARIPSPVDTEWARNRGFPPTQIDFETEKYHLWTAEKGQATSSPGWRKWMLRAEPEKPNPASFTASSLTYCETCGLPTDGAPGVPVCVCESNVVELRAGAVGATE